MKNTFNDPVIAIDCALLKTVHYMDICYDCIIAAKKLGESVFNAGEKACSKCKYFSEEAYHIWDCTKKPDFLLCPLHNVDTDGCQYFEKRDTNER